MSYPFDNVFIIYNPISTGDSESDAKNLQDQLKTRLPKRVTVDLRPTEYAGHAVEIAADLAKQAQPTLLVSASGDGGYSEVVNGALTHPKSNLTVVVMPSGNANDHHHATASRSFVDRIVSAQIRPVDILEVELTTDGKQQQRFAHSYVGVGMTAYIAKRLNATKLNPVNEKILVLKHMMRFGHVTMRIGDETKWRRYSNLLLANIDRMSKVIKLDDDAEIDDGQFEVYQTFRQPVMATLRTVLVGAVYGLEPKQRVSRVTFTAKQDAQLQCDGEVYQFDGGQTVTVRIRKQFLKTLA